jgi:putative PEP-CTERM system TPR-repeat lipoprotein
MKKTSRLIGAICLCSVLALSACDRFVPVEKKIARAEKRLEAGDQRAALIELQNVVRSEPGNVPARLLLAKVSLQIGDATAARKELDQAIAAGATPAQTSQLLAEIMLAQGKAADLLADIESGKLELAGPRQALYRGLALLASGQSDPAAQAFHEALRLDPGLSRAHTALAEMAMAGGDSEAALAEIAEALKVDATDAQAWLLRGTLLVRRGEFKEAVAALQSARERAPNQLSVPQLNAALAALTEAQLASGDKDAARKTQQELSARAPDAPATQLLAARLAMAEQDYAAATVAARKALAAAPNFIPARMVLGAALLAQGSLNQAEVELSDVVRAAPESIEARKLLAQVNLRLQRPDVAMQVLAPAQHAATNDAQLNALMGWANLQRGDSGSGIALLEKGVASQPDNVSLKVDLATAYISAGRNDDAVRLLESLPATGGDARRNALLINAIAASRGQNAAVAELDKLRAAEPGNVSLLNLGAAFHAQRGDFHRAREWIERAATLDAKSVSTLINRARIEVAAGDSAAAKQTLQQAAALDTSNTAPRLALVELALREGDAAGATQQLEQMRAADPKAVEPRLALIRLYMQQKKTRDADTIVREIQSRGADAATSQALGRIYLDAGRFDEALNFFRNAVSQDAGNPSYAMDVARAQLALGNTGSARETLQKSAQANPQSVAAAATLVLLDLREGRRDSAMSRLEALKQAHPHDASVAVLEGEVAAHAGDYSSAAAAYDRAYRLSPSAGTALRSYRARTQARQPDAPSLLEDWLRKHPGDESVRMVLAEAYMQSGKQSQAIAQYERLADNAKPHPMALNNLAWLYQQNSDPRATEVAKRAYEAAPAVPAIADTYGWILVGSGRIEEALPVLERAASAKDVAPDIRYHYAVALTKAGRKPEARAVLEPVVAQAGNSPVGAAARKLLGELGG